MTAHLILTSETLRPILAALEALAQEAEARRVALLHESGIVLADCGEDARLDQGESGALAAGAFLTARHLARRLGEDSFAGLHYQGVHRDFLLTAVDPESLVLIVFDHRTKPAIVRACAHKYLPALAAATAILRQQPQPAHTSPPPRVSVPSPAPPRSPSFAPSPAPPPAPVAPAWLPDQPILRECAPPGRDLAACP